MKRPFPSRRRGLTVVEVAIGAVLVGTLLVSSLRLLGGSLRMYATTSDLLDGPMLAEQLLAEIMSQPYEDPEDGSATFGLESGESSGNRNKWDDVDDYNGHLSGPPRTKNGVDLDAYTGWNRAVAVAWIDADDGAVNPLTDSGQKRITVTVLSPTGRPTTRYGFRTRWGALEQPPTVDSTVVTYIESSLEIGTSGARADWSSNLVNHATDPNAN
jgi:hypothetical protein